MGYLIRQSIIILAGTFNFLHMKKGLLQLIFLLSVNGQGADLMAQGTPMKGVYPMAKEAGEPIICYSVDENMHSFVPFREDLQAMSAARTAALQAAVFEVNYFGFNAEQRAAFQFAVDIWSSLLTSEVPIRIDVAMRNDMAEGTLASTGWGGLNANFKNAQKINTWYVVALAEKMAGSSCPAPGWYSLSDTHDFGHFDFVVGRETVGA